MIRPHSYAALVGLTLMTACSTANPPSPSADPRGRWTGALVTEQGECQDTDNSVLLIDDDTITFAPANGSVILKGVRSATNDLFIATLTQQDPDHKPYRFVFQAHPVGNAIGGIYATPKCRAHIVMTRTRA